MLVDIFRIYPSAGTVKHFDVYPSAILQHSAEMANTFETYPSAILLRWAELANTIEIYPSTIRRSAELAEMIFPREIKSKFQMGFEMAHEQQKLVFSGSRYNRT
jgi:hypothetical protein